MKDDFKRTWLSRSAPWEDEATISSSAARKAMKLDLRQELQELEQTCPYCGGHHDECLEVCGE